MSQTIFTSIDPAISGDDLATALNGFKDAVVSGLSGTSRPATLQTGGAWIDTTNNPTSWAYKVYTGSVDITLFTLDLTSGTGGSSTATDSFQIKKVSSDTVGAILQLVKQRAGATQVLDGDVVGEIRITGRTNTSTGPVVAKIIWTSTDNMTTSASGGTLSFMSTADGTASLVEHMRFINGLVETVLPLKINSEVLVGQNISTTATIAQLSATQILAEMTGSTNTDIQGINSAQATQLIFIHNRSSAAVTLKHQNGSASAADRLKLPNSLDYVIKADCSATLYYCTTDTRWKILTTSETSSGFTTDKLYGAIQTWTAPGTSSFIAKIRGYQRQRGIETGGNVMRDAWGNAFAWGINANGQLGVGDVIPRSSPVAVLGGLNFLKTTGSYGSSMSMYGITVFGAAFAWGANDSSRLGVAADVVPRSSPVAVLGGFRWNTLYPIDSSVVGLTTNGTAFAWGVNTNGQLGVGDVTLRSSPVAVLGPNKWFRLSGSSAGAGSSQFVGINTAGAAFAWGVNTNGNLGVNDVTPRSSPVAVLGSHVFQDVIATGSQGGSQYHMVGLDTAGAAWSWGNNSKSQLGVGDQTPRSSPVAVLGSLVFNRIFAGRMSQSIFGLTAAGTAYGWGENSKGVVGDGTIVDKSSPVAVLGGLSFYRLFPYKGSVLGLTADGSLYGWGVNSNGQLGVGDVVARSSPVAVVGGVKFSDIAWDDAITDDYSVAGLGNDGQLYMWGVNANGTLGLGDVAARSSPVAILGAFAPDATEKTVAMDLTVAGGTGYSVVLGQGQATFGGIPIGRDLYRIEVEYVQ